MVTATKLEDIGDSLLTVGRSSTGYIWASHMSTDPIAFQAGLHDIELPETSQRVG